MQQKNWEFECLVNIERMSAVVYVFYTISKHKCKIISHISEIVAVVFSLLIHQDILQNDWSNHPI